MPTSRLSPDLSTVIGAGCACRLCSSHSCVAAVQQLCSSHLLTVQLQVGSSAERQHGFLGSSSVIEGLSCQAC